MQIGQRNGNPLPTAEFEKLDRTTKMLVFLLGLKAAAILDVGKKTRATVEHARRRPCNAHIHQSPRGITRSQPKFCARYVLIVHSRSLAAQLAIDEPVEGRLAWRGYTARQTVGSRK